MSQLKIKSCKKITRNDSKHVIFFTLSSTGKATFEEGHLLKDSDKYKITSIITFLLRTQITE